MTILNKPSTSNAAMHLLNMHRIPLHTAKTVSTTAPQEVRGDATLQDIDGDTKPKEGFVNALATRVSVTQFRRLLVSWIIRDSMPMSSVKSSHFRKLPLCL